jgi:hypothetical protein
MRVARLILAVGALAVAGLVPASAVAASTARENATEHAVKRFTNQKTVSGFYKGKAVKYLDLGPVKLKPGNKVAPIWVVENGAAGQGNIIDVAPGDAGYTPLWKVVMVKFADGATPRVLKSAAEVKAAQAAGDVSLKQTGIVVNCPVLGFGQKETIGFENGREIAYFDLGMVKLRPGNKVAPIWVVENGASGQRNVIDVVPGEKGYTPLWSVVMVKFTDGVTPRVLRSAREIQAAKAAGDVTLKTTAIVVNCPVV